MKVVHLSFGDSRGGAAIAAFRHCEAMRACGIDSEMLVLRNEKINISFVKGIFRNNSLGILISQFLQHLMFLLLKPFKIEGFFSVPFLSISIHNHPLIKDADIVYLHWIAGSMISNKEIKKLLDLNKPVRWFMHDMQPLTGGCHHSLYCVGYKTGCINCPFIKNKFLGLNLAKRQAFKRMKLWKQYSNLEAYTPSTWLSKKVQESAIWNGHTVKVFPNVLNVDKYKPTDKKVCREILGVKEQTKLVLFGAAGLSDSYKGWDYLKDSLNVLDSSQYTALIFGEYNENVKNSISLPCVFTGYLKDEYSLILVYNAADVFVSSSMAENYPNVIMEAMACGLPCVAFNIGGIPDQIHHKSNGYLVDFNHNESLADGIRYICDLSNEEYTKLQENARLFVCTHASYQLYNMTNV